MLIEQNTNYAYKLKYMGNPTFDKVRDLSAKFYRELPQALQDELHEALNRGIDILDSEPQMTAYLFSFSKMHQAKLEYAFNHLPEEFLSQPEINIIDYGCGQALGTMCYADFLRDRGYVQKVKTVTLIEPSECCLKRAVLHTSVFFPEAEIRTVHKTFDELCEGDICCDEYTPTLHILSNVLDMLNFDLKQFSNLVKLFLEGYNQFVCVGPCFFDFERDKRMDVFFERVGDNECFSETLDQYKLDPNKAWTCKVKVFSSSKGSIIVDEEGGRISYFSGEGKCQSPKDKQLWVNKVVAVLTPEGETYFSGEGECRSKKGNPLWFGQIVDNEGQPWHLAIFRKKDCVNPKFITWHGRDDIGKTIMLKVTDKVTDCF